MSGGSWVVENQWTCSTCGTVNAGREMRCTGCGKPKEQEAYQTSGAAAAPAVTDDRLVQMAQGGVNRNLHDRCERCGAEKADSAQAPNPAAGQQPGVPGMTVTPMAAQGLPAGATVTKVAIPESKAPWGKIGCVALIVGMCLLGIYMFRGRDGVATVQSASWKTETRLEQRTVRQGQGFQDAMPDGGVVQSCEQRTVGTMPCNPHPCVVQANGQCNPRQCNCTNQCRDLGNGFSECQQVCQTCYDTCQVGQQSTCYQQCPRVGMYCRYTYDEWRATTTREQTGTSGTPTFATDVVATGPDQRVAKDTTFTVVFTQDGETYEFHPDDLAAFQRFTTGQTWNVTTSVAGGITPVAPR